MNRHHPSATARPWRVQPGTRQGKGIIIGLQGQPVARCLREAQWDPPSIEQQENVRLILDAVEAIEGITEAVDEGSRMLPSQQIAAIRHVLRWYQFIP